MSNNQNNNQTIVDNTINKIKQTADKQEKNEQDLVDTIQQLNNKIDNQQITTDNQSNQSNQEDNFIPPKSYSQEEEEAAIKIQAVIRGHQVRRQLSQQKQEEKEEKITESENDQNSKEEEQKTKNQQHNNSQHNKVEQLQEKEEQKTEQENQETKPQPLENEQEATKMEEQHKEKEQEKEVIKDEPKQDSEQKPQEIELEKSEKMQTKPEKKEEQKIEESLNNEEKEQKSDQSTKLGKNENIHPETLNEEEEQAAIKIQATFRGYQVRKQMKEMEEQVLTENTLKKVEQEEFIPQSYSQEEEEAAIKIQAAFKGHLVRKELAETKTQEMEKAKKDSASTNQSDDFQVHENNAAKQDSPDLFSEKAKTNTSNGLDDSEKINDFIDDFMGTPDINSPYENNTKKTTAKTNKKKNDKKAKKATKINSTEMPKEEIPIKDEKSQKQQTNKKRNKTKTTKRKKLQLDNIAKSTQTIISGGDIKLSQNIKKKLTIELGIRFLNDNNIKQTKPYNAKHESSIIELIINSCKLQLKDLFDKYSNGHTNKITLDGLTTLLKDAGLLKKLSLIPEITKSFDKSSDKTERNIPHSLTFDEFLQCIIRLSNDLLSKKKKQKYTTPSSRLKLFLEKLNLTPIVQEVIVQNENQTENKKSNRKKTNSKNTNTVDTNKQDTLEFKVHSNNLDQDLINIGLFSDISSANPSRSITPAIENFNKNHIQTAKSLSPLKKKSIKQIKKEHQAYLQQLSQPNKRNNTIHTQNEQISSPTKIRRHRARKSPLKKKMSSPPDSYHEQYLIHLNNSTYLSPSELKHKKKMEQSRSPQPNITQHSIPIVKNSNSNNYQYNNNNSNMMYIPSSSVDYISPRLNGFSNSTKMINAQTSYTPTRFQKKKLYPKRELVSSLITQPQVPFNVKYNFSNEYDNSSYDLSSSNNNNNIYRINNTNSNIQQQLNHVDPYYQQQFLNPTENYSHNYYQFDQYGRRINQNMQQPQQQQQQQQQQKQQNQQFLLQQQQLLYNQQQYGVQQQANYGLNSEEQRLMDQMQARQQQQYNSAFGRQVNQARQYRSR